MAIPTNEEIARNAEKARDLRQQVEGLSTEALPGVVFLDLSEGRTPVTIYSTEDGRPVTIPEYMLRSVIDKRREDGAYRFVADKADAPEYKLGDIKCFLHPDAPERAVVEAIGLGGVRCRKHTLPSEHAKYIHAEHRHGQEWAAYQRHVEGRAEEKREKRQDDQLQATLEIARAAQRSPSETAAPVPTHACDDCEWTPKADAKDPVMALRMHRRVKHVEAATP